jgi:ABC-type antimicrobial peptide transport system permease subunit
LFIPILIAALIVMNTMPGSVYERVREIGVFNAVGLAPSHSAI